MGPNPFISKAWGDPHHRYLWIYVKIHANNDQMEVSYNGGYTLNPFWQDFHGFSIINQPFLGYSYLWKTLNKSSTLVYHSVQGKAAGENSAGSGSDASAAEQLGQQILSRWYELYVRIVTPKDTERWLLSQWDFTCFVGILSGGYQHIYVRMCI